MQDGKDIQMLKNGDKKYKFKNLFAIYIEQKHKKYLSESSIKKLFQWVKHSLLPNLGDLDVKNIKYTDLLVIFNAIYNPNNPYTSRLEMIHRLINHLQGVLKLL